jgi:hypothetical protein
MFAEKIKQLREFYQKRSRLKRLYVQAFSGEGEEILIDLFKNFHMFESTFDNNPNQMYFKEGQKSVVMEILRQLDMDFEKFRKLHEESINEGE